MDSLRDLVEEAKLRALWWTVCILLVSYLLSLTSQSIWANIPIAIFFLGAFRTLVTEVEFRRKVRSVPQSGYLVHLQKKQVAMGDPILSARPSVAINWKRKIDSPVVEAALDEFIGMVLKDFVVDLWYSSITPDKEAPELIRAVVKDVCGEIAQRVKEINLVDLLTRDVVKLVGSHLDLYRRNQSAIGVELMATLSMDARDERLKRHLFVSKELHPALISSECEYKVLQEMMGGVLAVVLGQQEVQCPLIRCMSRELLTCLVIQPLMDLAEPGYINELIELIFLTTKDKGEVESVKSYNLTSHQNDHAISRLVQSKYDQDSGRVTVYAKQESDSVLGRSGVKGEVSHANVPAPQVQSVMSHLPAPDADWARELEAVRERQTQVLAPQHLENLWTRGKIYKSEFSAHHKSGDYGDEERLGKETITSISKKTTGSDKCPTSEMHLSQPDASCVRGREDNDGTCYQELNVALGVRNPSTQLGVKVNWELNNRVGKESETNTISQLVIHNESSPREPHALKIKCRVVGAYFEKIGSKSFAVYSIAVTSNGNETWFVRRRYRNFERLHRHLSDIPNYLLHLPPKRFLSSSIDDYLVHQRCLLLNKYLQDLLSIANVAEQHEVWDFLSASSKNYSCGKPTSIMKSLAVNVDDAMDESKGVSDEPCRKVIGSPDSSSLMKGSSGMDEEEPQQLSYSQREQSHSASEDEDHVKSAPQEEVHSSSREWHSDNVLAFKQFPPRVIKQYDNWTSMESRSSQQSEVKSETCSATDSLVTSALLEDLVVPPEWTPPDLSIPLLDLVDTIFQLRQRGWLRRQVFWMSKQILPLVMEDAIDDWLLRQIRWFRREDVVAEGIKWLQDVLWPEGTFFRRVNRNKLNDEECLRKPEPISGFSSASFEVQREAARRAHDIKKMILGGAPATLVSLIGQKQYRRCAEDLYYFLQLAYSILELSLVSIFPELKNLILNIHQKACY